MTDETTLVVPENIVPMSDFRVRTVLDVKNLRWHDQANTVLIADVLFEELEGMGHLPFSTSADADTRHGLEIWGKALAGDYGPIADYIPPTPQQLRAMMPPLAKWRVDTIIDLEEGLRDKINAAIARMPEPKRTISRNKLASVTEFSRLDTLFDDIVADPEVGKSPEDIDLMWQAGAALE